MKKIALLGALALFHLALGPQRATAFSSGIFDVARPGAGCNCHGGTIPPNTVTQLVIDGLPEAYAAGESYDLTLWVLGAAVPTGPSFAGAFFGYNLEASAGTLVVVDGRSQVRMRSECEVLKFATGCSPSTNCGVVGADLCRTGPECAPRRCATPGGENCRACSAEIVYLQATHSTGGGTDPAAGQTDGNSTPTWGLRWTAPAAGAGDVTFYMAGNVVNGGGSPDAGDLWSVLDPPVVVPAQ